MDNGKVLQKNNQNQIEIEYSMKWIIKINGKDKWKMSQQTIETKKHARYVIKLE